MASPFFGTSNRSFLVMFLHVIQGACWGKHVFFQMESWLRWAVGSCPGLGQKRIIPSGPGCCLWSCRVPSGVSLGIGARRGKLQLETAAQLRQGGWMPPAAKGQSPLETQYDFRQLQSQDGASPCRHGSVRRSQCGNMAVDTRSMLFWMPPRCCASWPSSMQPGAVRSLGAEQSRDPDYLRENRTAKISLFFPAVVRLPTGHSRSFQQRQERR